MYATISWAKDFSCVHDLTHRSYRYMFVCLFVPLSVVIWHLTTLATDNRVDDAVVNRPSKLANRGDFSNSIYLFYNAPSNLNFFFHRSRGNILVVVNCRSLVLHPLILADDVWRRCLRNDTLLFIAADRDVLSVVHCINNIINKTSLATRFD